MQANLRMIFAVQKCNLIRDESFEMVCYWINSRKTSGEALVHCCLPKAQQKHLKNEHVVTQHVDIIGRLVWICHQCELRAVVTPWLRDGGCSGRG